MYSASLAKLYRHMDIGLFIAIALTFIFAMNYSPGHIGGFGLTLPFNLATWIGLSVILLIGILKVVILNRLFVSKIFFAYLICVAILLLPVLFNLKLAEHMGLMISAMLASLILLLLVSQNKSASFKRKVLAIIYVSCLVQTAYGLVQYYFIYQVGPFFTAADVGQPNGVFAQKNVFSTYIAVGSMLALYFLFTAKHKSKTLIVLTFIFIALNAHLTMLAEAKTGRVVPIIAIAIYLAYCSHRHKTKSLCAALLLCCIAASFMPKSWFDVRPEQTADAPVGIQSFGIRPILYEIGVV